LLHLLSNMLHIAIRGSDLQHTVLLLLLLLLFLIPPLLSFGFIIVASHPYLFVLD